MLPVILGSLLVAAMLSSPAPPPPDPYPVTQAGWSQVVPITWGAYDIDLPAVDENTGKEIQGMYFHCHVPVKWHGRRNKWGHMTCQLRKR